MLNFIYDKILKKFLKAVHLDLTISRTNIKITLGDYQYEKVYPIASYAPWLSDNSFKETYQIIEDYTMVCKYRCYELWQLVKESAKLKEGALLEVGVWRGGTGALIAKRAHISRIKETIYLCDTFTGVVHAGDKDSTYKGGEHSDTLKKTAQEVINRLKLDNTKILAGIFPEETSKLVDDKVFRFWHIDVDVYESAKQVLEWVWPKLVVGGMVVFDDYGFMSCDGVTHFVNEERSKKDRIVIHNLNGHAIFTKIAN